MILRYLAEGEALDQRWRKPGPGSWIRGKKLRSMIPRYLAEGEALDAPELHVEEDEPGEVEDKEEEDGAQQRLRLVHLLVPVPVHQGKSHRSVGYVVLVLVPF